MYTIKQQASRRLFTTPVRFSWIWIDNTWFFYTFESIFRQKLAILNYLELSRTAREERLLYYYDNCWDLIDSLSVWNSLVSQPITEKCYNISHWFSLERAQLLTNQEWDIFASILLAGKKNDRSTYRLNICLLQKRLLDASPYIQEIFEDHKTKFVYHLEAIVVGNDVI